MWMPNSGVWIDLLDPDYTNVIIDDITIPLSRVCRYTGQLPAEVPLWRASVLTHMGLCYDIAEGQGIHDERLLRTIFMHDAQEAVIQDVSGPAKAAMRKLANPWGIRLLHSIGNEERGTADPFVSHYDVVEQRHEEALAKRFDLIMPKPDVVKQIDRLAFAFEVLEFFGEERSAVSEVELDPADVPMLAQRRRHYYEDPEVLVRSARLMTGMLK